MAWTNWGFDGTINEAQWAQMAGLLGNGYVAAGNGDCLVTAVAGARSVSVAAGTLYGDGVVSVNSAPETVAMTTPVNGQWYVIALRRTWATNTAALVAIAGATTTTTTPTAPPTSFPTLNTNVGVLTDQPIAWAWCNSSNTTVVVYDIRLKAVKSLPPVVANATERDAKFMSPTQGLQVWRDDLGAIETYYGLYNASTNPGGRDAAGWYMTDRETGLTPMRPTTATFVTGTGSTNALGVVSFSGCTKVNLVNVFTADFAHYRMVISLSNVTQTGDLLFRLSNNGSEASGAEYHQTALQSFANDTVINHYKGAGLNTAYIGGVKADSGYYHTGVYDIKNPKLAAVTTGSIQWGGLSVLGAFMTVQGHFMDWNATSFDGLSLWLGGGNMTGTIQVFGYND